ELTRGAAEDPDAAAEVEAAGGIAMFADGEVGYSVPFHVAHAGHAVSEGVVVSTDDVHRRAVRARHDPHKRGTFLSDEQVGHAVPRDVSQGAHGDELDLPR